MPLPFALSRESVPPEASAGASDPLWTLVRKGTLSGELASRAFAIRRAYELLTVTGGPASARTTSRPTGSAFAHGAGRSGNAMRAAEQAVALQERFNTWVEAMDAGHMPTGPVLDVIVEGFSCRAIERRCRKRNGWMGRLLVDSLALYGESHSRDPKRDAGTAKVIGVAGPEGAT